MRKKDISRRLFLSVLVGAAISYAAKVYGGSIELPGKRIVQSDSPILSGGHFYWHEATRNRERIPRTTEQVLNIEIMARYMEEIRRKFGNKPVNITSWYRDPETNRRVGGAKRSQHLTGGAVDFKIKGVSPNEVYKVLNPSWPGGLGKYTSFTHIDNRHERGLRKARW